MNRLQGQIVLITGASRASGIGGAICKAMAAEGADIFFTHYTPYDHQLQYEDADHEWPDRLITELREYHVRAAHIEWDLATADPERLISHVEQLFGTPTILVNNATHCQEVDHEALSAAILDQHYAVNIRGTCMLSIAWAKRLKGHASGRMINLVSGQDKSPMPGNLAYVATKGAISAFTRSLAAELAAHSITVNAVDPGPTDTGWMTNDIKNFLLPKFPMGRIGLPSDAAKLITFLASEEAAWVTGQIIHSDGGYWD
ncbi:3-oxoacyl-[acyl-carrier protein] reductase [Paenibacillus phyllosphaerae]|uniref:3-oxoacyl-[acyl-carrier protein] reductase n=1 Tax=Paenibacillus phyllosphaerae TaxID=274593 RepID=A0A7W5FNR4_9BACL|nr:SDR family oxidoreductase [Paenibacillus phyllosphaerae]MBB3111284.1 3-oxoacyl-[acyl-carrier protein] reductase [Paenibacillus phyllosphaerae]